MLTILDTRARPRRRAWVLDDGTLTVGVNDPSERDGVRRERLGPVDVVEWDERRGNRLVVRLQDGSEMTFVCGCRCSSGAITFTTAEPRRR